MRRNLLVLWLAVMFSGYSGASTLGKVPHRQSPTKASNGRLNDRFVGTWKLASIEQRTASGELLSPPSRLASGSPPSIGFAVYDSAGYVAMVIMPIGRQKYASSQPTGEEARVAMAGYVASFGTFTVNEAERAVTHHLQGSLNPADTGLEQKASFEFSGNRLALTPPPGATGHQSRLIWERVPDLPNLTSAHRRFIGFWKLVSSERRNTKGELLSSAPGQTGYILYTASGQMMVHMMQPNRQPYAGVQPTTEEARETLRTYTNYFGPYYIHEADRYVVHDEIGTLNVGRNGPSPQQRFYDFSGRRLMLKPPPTTVDGESVQATITWERVGGGGASQR